MKASTIRSLSLVLSLGALAACKTTQSGAEAEVKTFDDADDMRQSTVDSNYWIVNCKSGISEIRHKNELAAQKFCESITVRQFYSPDRKESWYTANPSDVGPNYGDRGVRFNALKYPMTNEAGQPLTQELTHCFNVQQKDHFLSVNKCNGPGEEGQVKELVGYVLKPNQAVVGATMKLLRCVRPATAALGQDTKYSHDGATCQPGYALTGSPMGVILRKFPSQPEGQAE